MASDLALRLYTVATELGEALPRFSRDDVLDFQIREALVLRGLKHKAEQAKKREREQWKSRPVGS